MPEKITKLAVISQAWIQSGLPAASRNIVIVSTIAKIVATPAAVTLLGPVSQDNQLLLAAGSSGTPTDRKEKRWLGKAIEREFRDLEVPIGKFGWVTSLKLHFR